MRWKSMPEWWHMHQHDRILRVRLPASFSGELCQHDPCVTSNACLNDATCVMDNGDMKCQCPPAFTGSDCGKEKPGDYDLQFLGGNGACQPPSLILQEKSRLTVCLWVRFHSQQGGSTYLSLASDNGDSNGYTMLVMSGNIVSVSLSGKVDPQRFELNIMDGKWHHVCYQWSNGRHTVFVDGRLSKEEVYGTDVALPNKLSLRLGHSVNGTSVQSFQGELSQANIYSRPVNASEMEAMGSNCSASRAKGDVYSWAVSDSYLKGEVSVVIPSVCGGTQCPPGFHGDFCNTKTDKVPPTVVWCPSDLSIVNTSVMVRGEWTEPVFQDNIGIMRTQQTHRSGQAFRHGEYVVRYIAYDAENNSAECNFRIIVKPFSCVEPPPPVNGGKVCQTWLHGSFCSVNCWPTFGFVELPPPFYTCGKLGFWDPPRGNPFRFPSCTAMRPPLVSLVGKMEVTGPLCSQQFKAALKSRFSSNMKQLDATLGLCKTDTCNFENGFNVTCDVERKRRRKRSAGSTYHMSINMTVSSNSSALQKENGNWAADAMHTAIKHGQFNDETFTADPSSLLLTVNYHCQPGQVFRTVEGGTTSRVCLDCPAGYFFSRELNSCELCPVGTYSSEPRQLQCQSCPSNATTAAPGASSSTDCFPLCGAGSYYSRSVCQCISCPAGQYQDSPGQTACRNCPLGQTTKGPGAGSKDQCENLCELGYELSSDGACWPCPIGSYRETHHVPVCGPCPYGWTTAGTGASSVSSCTIVVCKPGLYHTTSNQCAPCLHGTYQPSRGSDTCIFCGPGLTTESEGASSRTQCMKGLVDECQMGSHFCHKEAVCKDQPDMYSCVCNKGYTGDGWNCTDVCENYCGDHGKCEYDVDGKPICSCQYGYTGPRCLERDIVSAGLSSAIAGAIAGSVVAVIVIIIISAFCYWRHRSQLKESQNRIYRSHHHLTPAAFYNEGYESTRDSLSNPSQLIVREQDSSSSSGSSLSIAPRWNRCTFANSDEDEMDAYWFDALQMDDLSLGSDAFSRPPGHCEMEHYF